MRIEVWSDFTCPFCYIGKRKLELALEKFYHKQHVKVEFKSFRLDREASHTDNEKIQTLLEKKYCLPSEKVNEMMAQISGQAKQVGLQFQLDQNVRTDTLLVHRLMKYAAKQGKDLELVDHLFEAYFIRHEDIGKSEVLLTIAHELELDLDDVALLLASSKYTKAVELDEEIAEEIGITAVPFFIFNDEYALSGAQPIEVFLQVMDAVWEQEKDRLPDVEPAGRCTTTFCEGDECETIS